MGVQMKKIYLALPILVVALVVSFQNCSKSNFESGGDLSQSSSLESSTKTDSIGARVLVAEELRAPIQCPMIMCAAPPDNCHYEQDVKTDQTDNGDRSQRFCGGGCGRLVCDKPDIKICPAIMCAAPPIGCHYAAKTSAGEANKCATSCGELICKGGGPVELPPVDPNEPVSCPLYKCQAPPEGCHLDGINKKDENGCNIGCGNVVCPGGDATEINPTNVIPIKPVKPVICPMYMCAAPPQIVGKRCEYSSGPQALDKDGCPIGCGIVSCDTAESM